MLTVATIGDSLTDGGDYLPLADTWQYRLMGDLGESAISATVHTPPTTPGSPYNLLTGARYRFYLLGVSGQRSDEIAARFATNVNPLAPDVVHILAGSNDWFRGYSAAHIIANLDSMVTAALALGADVILGTIPSHNTFDDGEDLIPAPDAGALAVLNVVNTAIRNKCATTPGVYLADYHAATVAAVGGGLDPSLTIDGIHPNAAGSQGMADTVPLTPLGFLLFDLRLDFYDLAIELGTATEHPSNTDTASAANVMRLPSAAEEAATASDIGYLYGIMRVPAANDTDAKPDAASMEAVEALRYDFALEFYTGAIALPSVVESPSAGDTATLAAVRPFPAIIEASTERDHYANKHSRLVRRHTGTTSLLPRASGTTGMLRRGSGATGVTHNRGDAD